MLHTQFADDYANNRRNMQKAELTRNHLQKSWQNPAARKHVFPSKQVPEAGCEVENKQTGNMQVEHS
jgi:hypothetical protein